MSTNDPARPLSTRRAFLTAAAAIGAPLTALALSPAPDPVFALIEAERRAWDAFGEAIDAEQLADAAVPHDLPCVEIGTMTTFVDTPGQAAPCERKMAPVYASSRDELIRSYAKPPEPIVMEIGDERRVRLETVHWKPLADALAEFDAAVAARAASPERAVHERAKDRLAIADRAAADALLAVFSVTPTTTAGLFAILALFEAREQSNLDTPHREQIAGIFVAVRAVVGGRA